MACRWTELVIDANDPVRLAGFWSQVLDYPITDQGEHYAAIEGPSGPSIVFVRVPEPKTVKGRIHIDVNATDRDQMDEVARIKELGATDVDVGQGDVSWVVLADPEGNEFCVLRSRVELHS
jgi:predicted enzyme related to lactoylglutathione lyase